MKKYVLNKYTVIACITILLNLVLYHATYLSMHGVRSSHIIAPEIKKQFIDYISYRDSDSNKTPGEIYVSYNKLPVEEMIAVDILTNNEVIDSHDCYYYVTSYTRATGKEFSKGDILVFNSKLNKYMNNITCKYKTWLFIYEISPCILQTIVMYFAILIFYNQMKKSMRKTG